MTSNRISNLSIDCVIFGFEGDQLKVLLIERNTDPQKGMMALPGGFVHMDEELDDASDRILKESTGVSEIYMEQVKTFGSVGRYPLRRVITIAYYALIKLDDYNLETQPDSDAKRAEWFPVDEIPELPFDHREIFDTGFKKLKIKVRHEPVGFNLLPEKFSITELQRLYEATLETKFDKRNFRKKLAKMNLLIDLEEKQQNVSHRAAKLYSFDQNVYQQLCQKGFSFDL